MPDVIVKDYKIRPSPELAAVATVLQLSGDAKKDAKEFLEILHYHKSQSEVPRKLQWASERVIRETLATLVGKHFNSFGLKIREGILSGGDIFPREDSTIDVMYERIEIDPEPPVIRYEPETKLIFNSSEELEVISLIGGNKDSVIEDVLRIHYAMQMEPIIIGTARKTYTIGGDSKTMLSIAPATELGRFFKDARRIFERLGKEKLNQLRESRSNVYKSPETLREISEGIYTTQLIRALDVNLF